MFPYFSFKMITEIHSMKMKTNTFKTLAKMLVTVPQTVSISTSSFRQFNFSASLNGAQIESTPIPINMFQRTLLSVGAASAALLDPRRHDMVATLGETTGHRALIKIHQQMVNSKEGLEILKERPRINSTTVDLDGLRQLPEGTLGWCYIKFLDDNKVTPDSRLDVQFVEDDELRYVMQRYREVHDLFHSVLGMPTNMLGEVAVKWVEAMQTGLPMCIGAALFGPIRFRTKQRSQYVNRYLPWALKVGQESKPLMNVYYEKRWAQPILELREELNIAPFPDA